MFLSNFPVLLRMLFDYRLYGFLIKLYKFNKPNGRRNLYSYLRYMFELCYGEKIVYFQKQYVVNSFFPPILSKAFFTFIDSLNQNDDVLDAFVKGEPTAPISTFLKLTNRCNFSCMHCSANCDMTAENKAKQLSTSDWKKVIHDLQELGVSYIGFTGGEPLLCKDIEELVASVDDRSTTILFTNGTNLTYEKARALKKAGLFALSVSLDSAIEGIHNKIRGNKDAFLIALQAIRSARKAGLYTVVQSVIFKESLSSNGLFPLLRLVKKQGAHEVRIHQPAMAGKLLDSQNRSEIAFTVDDKRELRDLQFEANRKFFGFPKVSSFPYTEGPERFGCNAGIFHSYITETGELTPCDFIPFGFGSVLENSVADVYKKMRQAVGKRKMSCMAMQVAPYLDDKGLPISMSETEELCASVQTKDVPKIFQRLSS